MTQTGLAETEFRQEAEQSIRALTTAAISQYDQLVVGQ